MGKSANIRALLFSKDRENQEIGLVSFDELLTLGMLDDDEKLKLKKGIDKVLDPTSKFFVVEHFVDLKQRERYIELKEKINIK